LALPFFLYFAFIALKRRSEPISWLFAYTVIGLIANAAICASISAVVPRYQSRVVWLIVFVALIAGFLARISSKTSQRPGTLPTTEPLPR
jgi:hypothetical protein